MTLQASQEETSSPSPEGPTPAEQSQADFKQRVRDSLEKAGARSVEDEVKNSDVLDEEASPDPKAKPSSAAARAPSTKTDAARPAKEPATDKSAGGKTAEETAAEAERARPQPRYDSKSFSKWIENNPDKAAELAAKVFKVQLGDNPDAWKKSFIALENRRRRDSEANEAELKAAQDERAEVERLAKEAREPVEDIITLIEAEQKEDFPAIDRFIETTFKIAFDEYCRRRLRGLGKETVTERALKQKTTAQDRRIAELEAKLAGDDAKETPAAPKVSEKWLDKEIPADHGVRDLADWKAKVTAAYEGSRDEDSGDYEMSIEEAAEQVLAEFLSKRAPRPAAATPGKGPRKTPPPAPPRRPRREWSDDDEDSERTPARDAEAPPVDFAERTRWALDRAARRA